MQLSQISPYLIYEFKNESELIKAIEEISYKFTRQREHIQDYLNDRRLVAAYAAFYLTTNVEKLRPILKWLPNDFVSSLDKSYFIDIGSGPGTYSIALRELLNKPISIGQIETAALMREQAKKIWEGLYPGEELIQDLVPRHQHSNETFVLFGHSANEMGHEKVIKYLTEINPRHVLFIEPGTKAVFELMLKIRKSLIEMNYNILFPCPQSTECPLAGSNDWCHQYIEVRQDEQVERISQMAKKDRRRLPLTVMAFSKIISSELRSIRIIRTSPPTKFSFEWEACIDNKHVSLQVMKRGLSKIQNEKLENVMSGDQVEVTLEKELENYQRVKVLQINNSPL